VSRYDERGLTDLTPPWKRPSAVPEVPAERDLVVEEATTGFCGSVIRCEKTAEGFTVTLEDRHGKLRVFPLMPRGFLIDGRPVTLIRPAPSVGAGGAGGLGSLGSPGGAAGRLPGPARTASGSIAVQGVKARVALPSRIYVEGRHDAELVERVWGDDLRIEGVVVEYLEGIDDLPAIVAEFGPEPGRRLGVLVDHLVPGSKESRIASQVTGEHVLVVGHPFIDIWAAVKPAALGIAAWPEVPRNEDWKSGVCARLGWALDTPAAWRRILGAVRSYRDLDPALLGRVEELIDFVTS
jgi:hypothetical protein